MNRKDAEKTIEWITESSDTTEFCNRCLLVETYMLIESSLRGMDRDASNLYSALGLLRDMIQLEPPAGKTQNGSKKMPPFIDANGLILDRLITTDD